MGSILANSYVYVYTAVSAVYIAILSPTTVTTLSVVVSYTTPHNTIMIIFIFAESCYSI